MYFFLKNGWTYVEFDTTEKRKHSRNFLVARRINTFSSIYALSSVLFNSKYVSFSFVWNEKWNMEVKMFFLYPLKNFFFE